MQSSSHNFLPVPLRVISDGIGSPQLSRNGDVQIYIILHMFFCLRNCHFALLAHGSGLIDPFPDLNDRSGLLGVSVVDMEFSILAHMTHGYSPTGSVYFTADHLPQPFVCNIPLRICLGLTVPVSTGSLPYPVCVTAPVSRCLSHSVRTSLAWCPPILHKVFAVKSRCRIRTDIPLKSTKGCPSLLDQAASYLAHT